MAQKLEKLSIAEVRLPFRDMARNGQRGSPNLIAQAVDLAFWELVRSVVDSLYQFRSPVPSDKVGVMF